MGLRELLLIAAIIRLVPVIIALYMVSKFLYLSLMLQ